MGILLGDSKLISVVIPVYNCERYLSEAIESVQRQSYKPIEIIVVDDGSADRSGEIAKRFGSSITYVLQLHRGIAAARNAGINMSKGAFLAFLDADDLWTENKVMLQMDILIGNPAIDCVFGHVRQFLSPDISPETRRKVKIPREVMPGYVPSTALIRRESFFRVGFFGENWHVGEFIDWYLIAREQGMEDVMLKEIVLRRRIHDGNTGIRQSADKTDYVRILKSSLDRRRQQQKDR
jgi:glycosyltransferase involved in cell wall biosynthesis